MDDDEGARPSPPGPGDEAAKEEEDNGDDGNEAANGVADEDETKMRKTTTAVEQPPPPGDGPDEEQQQQPAMPPPPDDDDEEEEEPSEEPASESVAAAPPPRMDDDDDEEDDDEEDDGEKGVGGGDESSRGAASDTADSSPGVPGTRTIAFDEERPPRVPPLVHHADDSSSQSRSLEYRQQPQQQQQQQPQQQQPQSQAPLSYGRPLDPGCFIKREPYAPLEQHNPYEPYGAAAAYAQYGNQGGFKQQQQQHQQQPYAPYAPFGGAIKREQPDLDPYEGVKRERADDPYSFVDEEAAVCAMLGANPGGHGGVGMHGGGGGAYGDAMLPPHIMPNVGPKKRGRKKKIKDECFFSVDAMDPASMMPVVKPVKERKKHDRFNGMSEEEVSRRTLPDHLTPNLDIIIIGINPGLFAAYKGHHYAGPGNHFWKCLYLSGLTQEQMSADEDYKLLHFGIGFTNMVQRATKGSADLTRKEIKEGGQILLEKLQTFRPKIAVFNGKLIYEVFSGKKDFCFGRQPDTVHGTNTYMWVMPSSSARCAQLPRAADKVPFYAALKRFRDYLNGAIPHVDESELVFPDTTCRRAHEDQEIRRLIGPDLPCETMVLEDGTEVPVKKKRGRPKKIKLENGEVAPPTPRVPRPPKPAQPAECLNGEQPPKKKRGRPKKIRPEEQFLAQQQQAATTVPAAITQPLPSMPLNQSANLPQQTMESQYPQNSMQASREFQQGSLPLDSAQLMYPNAMNLNNNNNNMGGGNNSQNQNPNVPSGPTTSPYFGTSLASNMNSEQSPGMDSNQQSIIGTAGSHGTMPRAQSAYGQSPGPFSQSPRSHGVGFGSSPRPGGGYSQSPQRHQPLPPPSYSNSPVSQQGQTQPYSQSPIPQNQNNQYSQSPPLRPLSQNRNYSQSSPLSGHPYSRSPVPQNNTPAYSQQSPMFSQSPANMAHPYSQSPAPPQGQQQGFAQSSPAAQSLGYPCRSPGPIGHSYPQSPMPQGGATYPQLSPAQAYSQSPNPQNMYSQSPLAQNQSYQHSPNVRGHPYSPHSLPHHHPAYGQSPIHQSQQGRHNAMYSNSPPQNMTMNQGGGPLPHQQYGNELSTEISAAISSPGPNSPNMEHIDFEPPMDNNQMHVQEAETNSSTHSTSQRNSPGGDQIQQSANANSESRDSADLMMQISNQSAANQNRHSALNLIGPSSSSNTSSPIPSMDPSKGGNNNMELTRNYTSSIYTQPNSNEAQSPVSNNEQRLGFQVPTPSGSANSSYGNVTPVAADLSAAAAVQRNSPREVDNASVASVSSQHERLNPGGGGGSYMGGGGGYPGETGNSPRQTVEGGGGLMAHHAASMYGNPFSRMGSPPHHPLGGSQLSSFSSQSGGGAFRGLPLDASQHSPQSLSLQGATGPPLDYGSSPPKPLQQQPPPPTKQQQQDVSSKSLSGLESLVDQIPSIADGGSALSSSDAAASHSAAPLPSSAAMENPYAAHAAAAPSLYGAYSPYQPSPYGPPANNGYSLAASGFVGHYPGHHSPYAQLMRPTPGYLPAAADALTAAAYHPAQYHGQYGAGGHYGPAAAPPPPPNYSAYYNGYGPAAAMQNTAAAAAAAAAAANMPTYLSSHVLDHIHKNAAADAAASSVSFGGFC